MELGLLNRKIDLRSFVNKEAHNLWEGKHLIESHAKLMRFCDFKQFGRRPINRFGLGDINDFLESLKNQGLTDNTLNHYRAALSSIFSYAVELKLIKEEHKIVIKWKKINSGRPRYLTKNETRSLISFLGSHKHWWMRHFVTIGLHTGMRLGEILSVTDNHIVKTDDGTWIHLLETKNGDERWVPANDKVIEALSALDNRPKKHYSHRKFYHTWSAARREIAKGDKHFVFHTLRHTAATNLANDFQVNSIVLGHLLGHRSVQTTKKYVHVKPTELQRIVKQMQQGDGA
jgi:integrase